MKYVACAAAMAGWEGRERGEAMRVQVDSNHRECCKAAAAQRATATTLQASHTHAVVHNIPVETVNRNKKNVNKKLKKTSKS